MDRFVTRTPTWKTLSYDTIVAKTANKSLKASTPHPLASGRKKPLQEKQTAERLNTRDVSRRLSQIFRPAANSTANAHAIKNYSRNSTDSGLSSASSISPPIMAGDTGEPSYLANSSPYKSHQMTAENHFGRLGDYVDCPEEKENDTCMTISPTPKASVKTLTPKEQENDKTPKKKRLPQPAISRITLPKTCTPQKQLSPAKNRMLMARIHRDLASPSASVRVRALKALSSPTKSPYTHFDIPESEQSIHFSNPQEICDIKHVMQNVVVYVEVRSGEDDRSEGVRKVIEALGARVNRNLNKDTTHVVFKEGRLSTFKKARQMGIPVVSILWIEACKTYYRICDPKDYPISNLDRYENPELYSKLKVFRHMQPGSECNKRRVKTPTTKDPTPPQKTGIFKKNSMISSTPTSSFITYQKTDISQFFKKIDKTNPDLTTQPKNAEIAASNCHKKTTAESSSSEIIKRITSEECSTTPSKKLKTPKTGGIETPKSTRGTNKKDSARNLDINSGSVLKKTSNVRRTLYSPKLNRVSESNVVNEATTPKARSRGGESSVSSPDSGIDGIKDSTKDSSSDKIPRSNKRRSTLPSEATTRNTGKNDETPINNKKRRSSIHTSKNMTIEASKRDKQFEVICEEIPGVYSKTENMNHPMDSAENSEVAVCSSNDLNKPTAYSRAGRRRTIYSYKTMNESGIKAAAKETSNGTCYSVKSIETADTMTNDNNKNVSDLCTTPSSSSNNNTIVQNDKTATNELQLSPTANNMQGNVIASSTLIEKDEKPTKFIETPSSATAISGNLLEETNEYNSPYLFSSSRKPGNKRRTLFDVSMDIITQRLQCINQTAARRTLVPDIGITDNTINDETVTKSLEILNEPPVADNKLNKSISLETEAENSTPRRPVDNDNGQTPNFTICSSAVLNKKRKLFKPIEPLTPPGGVLSTSTLSKLSTPLAGGKRRFSVNSSATKMTLSSTTTSEESQIPPKRRRSLMPSLLVKTTVSLELQSKEGLTPKTALLKNRRSTLDFESIQKEKKRTESQPTSKSDITAKQQNIPVIVYTNMHKEQKEVIREGFHKLGNCRLEDNVSKRTTHLVSLEPRRTMNLLRGLVRGVWILEYTWLLDSITAGELLPEEAYELNGFSNAIKICRAERQAFGNSYQCELFHGLGPFYVSLRCAPVKRDDLVELLTLCSALLTNCRHKARYVIGDRNVITDDKICLTPQWILDCITHMQIIKTDRYLHPNPFERGEPAPIKFK